MIRKYKNLFFDLDDTLWAFSENAQDILQQIYEMFGYNRYFDSFTQFYTLYERRNKELWTDYADGKVDKDELNRQRFLYPLEQVGHPDEVLAKRCGTEFFRLIPQQSRVKPHAHEVLTALSKDYNLYILSNGFEELQCHKMRSAGLDKYFKRVFLSDDIGILKPHAEFFHYALKESGSTLENSLMIGDSWENDIMGAAGVGMNQVYYAAKTQKDLPFQPTYQIEYLTELLDILQ